MGAKKTSFEFRLKRIYEARNLLLEEIERNELISKKHKKVCKALNYTKHLLILASTVTGYISVSPLGSLVYSSLEITSSVFGLKIV